MYRLEGPMIERLEAEAQGPWRMYMPWWRVLALLILRAVKP
jgi:hypothetical protein